MNLSSSSSRHGPPTDAKTFAPTDTIETAIDFVLALEYPCMPHIPYQNPLSPDPANHMMMASTPLMARAPDPPQLNSTWTASGATIKELLNLASSINLEGEITPVEAWHRLHSHSDFWKLDRDQIEELKRELSRSVRCCGYVWPSRQSHTMNGVSYTAPLSPARNVAPARTVPADVCPRFGAVLDEDVFWSAVNRSLASSAIVS